MGSRVGGCGEWGGEFVMDVVFFFFKQKTAYEIVSRDWSSDVCSSDLAIFYVIRVYLPAVPAKKI